MYKKIIISAIIYTLLFTSCASKSSNEGGQGTQVGSTIVGALVGMSSVYLYDIITGKKTTRNELIAGAITGGFAGFIIGNELSKMQKRYKSKENKLISDIIKIDKESEELAKKNRILSSKLNRIESTISQLQRNRNLKQRNKARIKARLRAKLRTNKQNLRKLIRRNRQISKKLSRSKSKAKQYNYSTRDKQNILSDINKLNNNSRQYERNLNNKLVSVDNMLRNLG